MTMILPLGNPFSAHTPLPNLCRARCGGTSGVSTYKAHNIRYIHTMQTCTYACPALEDATLRLSCGLPCHLVLYAVRFQTTRLHNGWKLLKTTMNATKGRYLNCVCTA